MKRPGPQIRVRRVYDRRKERRGSVIRWSVGTDDHSKSFRTEAEADDYRARLLIAARDGARWDTITGEPADWTTSADTIAEWAARWVANQGTWSQRSKRSAIEALTRAVPLFVHPRAPEPPVEMRAHLKAVLAGKPGVATCATWLERWSLPLGDVDRVVAADVRAALGLGDNGQPLAANTATRFRTTTHTMLADAAATGKLTDDPWPKPRKGRKRRAEQRRIEIDPATIPEITTVEKVLAAIVTHQPGSRLHHTATVLSLYGGLRPSEALALDIEHLTLPETGWGSVWVAGSVDLDGTISDTETGTDRRVPLPPVAVAHLRKVVQDRTGERLLLTRKGNAPSLSNWGRALHRACDTVGCPRLSPYDLRHVNASVLIRNRVSPPVAAKRLGHSIAMLLGVYAHVFDNDEEAANQLLNDAWGADTTDAPAK